MKNKLTWFEARMLGKMLEVIQGDSLLSRGFRETCGVYAEDLRRFRRKLSAIQQEEIKTVVAEQDMSEREKGIGRVIEQLKSGNF